MADSTHSDQSSSPIDPFDTVGLCKTCRYVRVVVNPRGSTFYMCQLADTDPRFAQYPRLPVIRCAGYEKVETK